MILEGAVTNVTNFGAFVDVGVHHDGLVHISELADRFVKDPRDVVKAGDVVKVKVLEVDMERRRIALTLRLTADHRRHGGELRRDRPGSGRRVDKEKPKSAAHATAMAQAFAKLKR